MSVKLSGPFKSLIHTRMSTPAAEEAVSGDQPAGTRLFAVDRTNNSLFSATLGSAWDLSTLSAYTENSNVNSGSNTSGIWVKPDGTQAWITSDGADSLTEFSFATAYDISTASIQQTISMPNNPTEVYWKSDGTQFWIIKNQTEDLQEYNVTTPFDVSTRSAGNVLFTNFVGPSGFYFSPDGVYFFLTGFGEDQLHRYTLSTPFDITTATQDQIVPRSGLNGANFRDVTFKPDGTKFFIINDLDNLIEEYSLSTPWDLTSRGGNFPDAQAAAPDAGTEGISFT